MAVVTGNDYDHIDIVNGNTQTRHMLKDTSARADVANLKSTLDNVSKTYNKLPTSYYSQAIRGNPATINGITYEVLQNGEIRVSGTASAHSSYYLAYPMTISAGDYRLILNENLPTGVVCWVRDSTNTTTIATFGNMNEKHTIAQGAYVIAVRVANGTVVPAGTVVKPMMCIYDEYPGEYIAPHAYDDALIPSIVKNMGFTRNYESCTVIPANTDLFTLSPGGYISGASENIRTYTHCPTSGSFRLEIIERISNSTYVALLFDSQDNIYVTNRPSSGNWHEWRTVVRDNDLTTALTTALEYVLYRDVSHSTQIVASENEHFDLFSVTPGSYLGVSNINYIDNCPTASSFRLEVFYRSNTSTYVALLFDSQDHIYVTNRPASGNWHAWRTVVLDTDCLLRDVINATVITATEENPFDLFSVSPGSYIGGSGIKWYENCPTNASFRMEVFYRNNASTYVAILFDSQDNVYVTNRPSGGNWHTWKKLLTSASEIDTYDSLPDYYTDYMKNRIADINALEDDISVNSDSFMFITDYHIKRNAGNSLKMITMLEKNTGITKLMFGGDAYQTSSNKEIDPNSPTTAAESKAFAQKYVPFVYSSMHNASHEFFSILGNHEWNHYQSGATENEGQNENTYELNLQGVYNYCIKRHESFVSGMSEEGNYYVDNTAKKIRYFFLQEDGEARPSNATLNWLGDQLLNVPNGYYVFVIAHYAYIPGSTSQSSPSMKSYTGRSMYLPKLISDMLHAYNTKRTFSLTGLSFTANGITKTYSGSWNYSSAQGNNVICILSGHVHMDAVLEKSANNILTIATTGDLYKSSTTNYTFVDEHGNIIERAPGTIYEQAFDVVHIDLEDRKVYLTRMGAGLDREYSF